MITQEKDGAMPQLEHETTTTRKVKKEPETRWDAATSSLLCICISYTRKEEEEEEHPDGGSERTGPARR